ncbi:MAG: holo-ACP synthase [Clostridiales bacterium]|nr:holo-ACP synthase [Clostridiales bacterium]
MIRGIGLDLCAVERMAGHLAQGRFLPRYFDEAEQAYILSRGPGAAASMAACFAAKEAFVKALGTGFEGVPTRDIVIEHLLSGQPRYVPRGLALTRMQALGAQQAHLSISHDGGMAAAVCILEGE